MTDLDKALAAAREALQNPDLPGDPVSVAMCDLLLAALDAAREQAVAWQVTVVDNTGTHDYAKWAGLQAPPAQPLVERYGDGVLVHWPEGVEQYVQVGDCVTGYLAPPTASPRSKT